MRLVWVATLIAGPVLAQARPAAIYPIASEELSAAECTDLEGTLLSSLTRTIRTGPLGPASPPTSTASCGSALKVSPACLAKAAGEGLVLYGIARKAGARITVSLSAVDARGRVAGPVRVTIDPMFDNPRVFEAALEKLAAGPSAAPGASRKPPPGPGAAPPAAASQGAPGAPLAPVAQPERPSAPVAAVVAPAPSKPFPWEGKIALGAGGGAVLALGGGLAAGFFARKKSDDLTSRYASRSLGPTDAASYQQVQRLDLVANSLFVASGVLALTSLVFWALVPDDEPGAGVAHF